MPSPQRSGDELALSMTSLTSHDSLDLQPLATQAVISAVASAAIAVVTTVAARPATPPILDGSQLLVDAQHQQPKPAADPLPPHLTINPDAVARLGSATPVVGTPSSLFSPSTDTGIVEYISGSTSALVIQELSASELHRFDEAKRETITETDEKSIKFNRKPSNIEQLIADAIAAKLSFSPKAPVLNPSLKHANSLADALARVEGELLDEENQNPPRDAYFAPKTSGVHQTFTQVMKRKSEASAADKLKAAENADKKERADHKLKFDA